MSSPPRPDLYAHRHAISVSFPELVDELRSLLGVGLVAYVASLDKTETVDDWTKGKNIPSNGSVESRLRLTLEVTKAIADVEGPRVAQAWFQGLNTKLDDRSAARLIREGDLDEIRPAVVGAERAFLAGV